MKGKARELIILLRRIIKLRGYAVQRFALTNNLGQNFFPQAIETGHMQLSTFLGMADSLEVPPHLLLAMVDEKAMAALDWKTQLKARELQRDLSLIHIRGLDDAKPSNN